MPLRQRHVKNSLLVVLGLMALATRVWSQAAPVAATAANPVEQKFNAVKVRETQLDKLLQIGFVKEKYEACKKALPDAAEKISNCIWNGTNGVEGLNESQKKEVQTKLASGSEGNKKKYEGLDINTVKTDKDPGIVKLQEYFHEQLRKALYGDVKENAAQQGITVVDHAVFYNLYETQISKNIVEAISSYCLDAEGDLKIPSDTEEVRKKNIESLKGFSAAKSSSSIPAKGSGTNSKSIAATGVNNDALTHFSYCAAEIQHVCHKEKDFETDKCSSTDANILKTCHEEWANTRLRACEVVNYIKSARQNLIALTAVREDLKKKGEADVPEVEIQFKNNVTVNEGALEGRSVDDITTLSSREVVETSGLRAADEEEAKKLNERCVANAQDPECKKFLVAGDEAKNLEEATAEIGVRSEAMLDKIKGLAKKDDELKKYLKEQGYGDSEIENLLKDKENLIKSIEKRYATEKDQLIASLKKRFEKIKSDDKSTTADKNGVASGDSTKIKAIGKELAEKPAKLAQLIHFNNIIFSLLEVDDGKKKSQNTTSFYKEIADSCQDPSKGCKGKQETGHAPASADSAYIKNLKENAEQNGIKKDTAGNKTGKSFLNVDTINKSLLDYDKPTP